LTIGVLACVLLLPHRRDDLLLERCGEQTLELVCKALSHIDVELGTVELWEPSRDVDQLELELNVASKQHERVLAVAHVRVLDSLEPRD
jgi:hypothetical protein